VPRLVVVVVVVVAFGGLYAAITRVAPSIGLPGSPDVGAHSSPDAVTADLLGKMYGSTSSGLGTEQTSATDIAPADRAAFAAGWTGSTAMPMNGISNAVADAGATSGTIEAVAVTQSQTTSTGTGTATVTMTVEVAMWTTDADATTANPHVLEHVTLDAVQVDGQWYVAYPWG
jgi:hypothetical protein